MALARGVPAVADAVILGIFPWWRFTPETYVERPDFIAGLEGSCAGGLHSRWRRSSPSAKRSSTTTPPTCSATCAAPTLITFGGRDLCTSTRFAPALTEGIADSTLVVFDDLSHAGLHEDPDTFNATSLDFLLSHRA